MTRFTVRCVFRGGTRLDLATPGRNAERAIWKAMGDRHGRKATAYLAYDRRGVLVKAISREIGGGQ